MKLFFSFLFFFSQYGHSMNIDSIINQIENSPESLIRSINNFKLSFEDLDHIESSLNELRDFYEIKNFKYEIDGTRVLVQGIFPGFIKEVKVEGEGLDGVDVFQFLPKVDEIFNFKKSREGCVLARDFLKREGFKKIKCYYEYDKKKGLLTYRVKSKNISRLKRIQFISKAKGIKSFITREINPLIGLRVNQKKVDDVVGEIKNRLLQGGHYGVIIDVKYEEVENDVSLIFNIRNDDIYIFKFNEDNPLRSQLKVRLPQEITGSGRFEKIRMINIIKKVFRENGYSSIGVNIQESKYRKDELLVRTLKVDIQPTRKTRIDEVLFKGSTVFSRKELLDIFYEESDDLTSSSFFDPIYYPKFISKLKRYYYNRGYLTVDVKKGSLIEDQNKKKLIFHIKEGRETKIEEVQLLGFPIEIKKEVMREQKWTVGEQFNPLGFSSIFKDIENKFGDRGYLNAKILTKDPDEVLFYSNKNQNVRIRIEVDPGELFRFKNYILLGNLKTRSRFITDRIPFKKGEIIRQSDLKSFRRSLQSLDLFEKINLNFVELSQGHRDLVIEVVEKKYGLVELAPGFRSDIGFKLSGRIGYENISGVRRNLNLVGQINRRITNSALENNRPGVDDDFTEFDIGVNYSELDLFDTDFSYNLSINYFSRRFFSFDAESLNFENLFVRTFNKHLSIGLRHQLNRIDQSNSLDLNDIGEFQIGSLTPSITLDYRDNPIFTRRGWSSDLSFEYADPILGSDSDIRFSRILLDNRLFFSLSRKSTLAIGFNFGLQINHNRSTRIPTIELFRFSGRNIIRGFSNPEANFVSDENTDVSNLDVLNKLFLVGLKVEPRYQLTENFFMGVFLDAGRIDLDLDSPLSLNSSVGLSLKYLTPVGTINFDYGVKLNRRDINGDQEDQGRLHISIGNF